MRYLSTAIGLVVANYLYQLVGPHDWSIATERTLFQAVAVLAVWLNNTWTLSVTRHES